jgi:hypothetical protein
MRQNSAKLFNLTKTMAQAEKSHPFRKYTKKIAKGIK